MITNIYNFLCNNLNFSEGINILLMLVYVIATIFICVFNGKSAKATREQIRENNKNFIEQARGRVIITFEKKHFTAFVFSIKNIGNEYATNVKVNINEDFLNKLENTEDELKKSLQILSNSCFCLAPKQTNEILVFPTLHECLFKNACVFQITYNTMGNQYQEIITIDLSQFEWEKVLKEYPEKFIDETIKNEDALIKEIKKINTNLTTLNFELNHFKTPLSEDAKRLLENISKNINLNDFLNKNQSYKVELKKEDVMEGIFNYNINVKYLVKELINFKYITNSSRATNTHLTIFFTKEGIEHINKIK